MDIRKNSAPIVLQARGEQDRVLDMMSKYQEYESDPSRRKQLLDSIQAWLAHSSAFHVADFVLDRCRDETDQDLLELIHIVSEQYST
jgi:alkylhydroperoxidase family enzyme